MKLRVLLSTAALVVSTSCAKPENTPKAPPAKKAEKPVAKPIAPTPKKVEKNHVQQFEKFLGTLPTGDMHSALKALAYFDTHLKGADPAAIDTCYDKFKTFHQKLMPSAEKLLLEKKSAEQYALYRILHKDSEALKKATPSQKALVAALRKNAFSIDAAEGDFMIAIDAELVAERIKDKVSPAMKEYLLQKKREFKEGFASDGGLSISPTTLAQRIVFWEKFNAKYPKFIYSGELVPLVDSLTGFLLAGMDNTPAFDYSSKLLDKEFKKAYLFIMKEHPTTTIGKVVKAYYAILKKSNFKHNKEAEAFIMNLGKG